MAQHNHPFDADEELERFREEGRASFKTFLVEAKYTGCPYRAGTPEERAFTNGWAEAQNGYMRPQEYLDDPS